MSVDLPCVLTVNPPVNAACIHLWANDREVRRAGQPEQKIAERVVGEATAEGEVAIVIGGREVHQGIEMLSARVQSKTKRMLADGFGEVIGKLDVARNG